MKKQNDHLHNGDEDVFASLKKCMQEITHKVLSQDCLPLIRQPERIGSTNR